MIHGFSDAPESAYVIYVVQSHEMKLKVTILVAKIKVAPLKSVSMDFSHITSATGKQK